MSYLPVQRPQKRFSQRFWGGFISGCLSGILILAVFSIITSRHSAAQHLQTTPQGSVSITLDDASLTNIMQIALSKVQNKIPVGLSHIAAQSEDGGQVRLNATATTVGGFSTSAYFVFTPTLDRTGQIQFQVNTVQLQGIDIPGIGAIMEAAIDSQFQQYTDGEYRGIAYHLLDIKTAKNQLIVVTQVTIR